MLSTQTNKINILFLVRVEANWVVKIWDDITHNLVARATLTVTF